VNHFPPPSRTDRRQTDQSTEVDSFHGSGRLDISLATINVADELHFRGAGQCCLALGLAETDGATEL
jgi:hypothetical protein